MKGNHNLSFDFLSATDPLHLLPTTLSIEFDFRYIILNDIFL